MGGGVENLALVLDAPGATYMPGDTLQGKLVFNLRTDWKMSGLYVVLKGECEVRWTESESSRDGEGETQTVSVTYFGSRDLVQVSATLLGGTSRPLTVAPGDHVHDFSLKLPRMIPPSYEGAHGHVRYRLMARLESPWSSGHMGETVVTVGAVVDLSLQPALNAPVTQHVEKTLCCLWCRSGPLSLVVDVPGGTGLLPGHSARICVHVDNATDSRITRVVCRLIQTVLFHARNPSDRTMRAVNKMASVELGAVEPRGTATLTSFLAPPGNLPPSGLPHISSLIQLSYCLLVKAEVSGPHTSPTVEIPVVLGTEPCRTENPHPPPQAGEPSAPPLPPPEQPPPSYEEIVHGTAPQSGWKPGLGQTAFSSGKD